MFCMFQGCVEKARGWFKPGLNHGLNRTGLFSKVHPGLLMDNWVDFSQISDYNIQENQASKCLNLSKFNSNTYLSRFSKLLSAI